MSLMRPAGQALAVHSCPTRTGAVGRDGGKRDAQGGRDTVIRFLRRLARWKLRTRVRWTSVLPAMAAGHDRQHDQHIRDLPTLGWADARCAEGLHNGPPQSPGIS
jgi:hypothetical protein